MAVDMNAVAAQAAAQIEAQLNVPQMVEELRQLPLMIRQQQERVHAARQAVDEARQELEQADAILTAHIAEEFDPRTGKPAFSNDTARKAELIKRRASDELYLQAQQRLFDASGNLSSAQFDLDLLQNRFSSTRHLADLTGDRLRLIGGAR